MDERKILIDRIKVGALAVLAFSIYGAILMFKPEWSGAGASILRMGILLSVIWIALPTKKRPAAWANVSPWVFVLLLAGLFLVVRIPWVVIPIMVVLGALSLFSHTRGGGSPNGR